jgi:hypothetical protein
MQKRITQVLSISLLAFGISSGSAMAQQAPTAKTPDASLAAPPQNLSNAKLEKFISASQQLAMISQEYTPKLQAAGDEAAQRKIYQEADDKMVKAVNNQGITVDEFNGINRAIEHDPQLAQRVREMVK